MIIWDYFHRWMNTNLDDLLGNLKVNEGVCWLDSNMDQCNKTFTTSICLDPLFTGITWICDKKKSKVSFY